MEMSAETGSAPQERYSGPACQRAGAPDQSTPICVHQGLALTTLDFHVYITGFSTLLESTLPSHSTLIGAGSYLNNGLMISRKALLRKLRYKHRSSSQRKNVPSLGHNY